jgi:hypothetical protein
MSQLYYRCVTTFGQVQQDLDLNQQLLVDVLPLGYHFWQSLPCGFLSGSPLQSSTIALLLLTKSSTIFPTIFSLLPAEAGFKPTNL